MKSILLSGGWLIAGVLSLFGKDLYAQNSFPSYGDVMIGAYLGGSNNIRLDTRGTITHTWNGGTDHRFILSSNGQIDFGFPVGWDAGALKLRGSANGYAILTAGGGYVNGGEGLLLFFLNQTATPQMAIRASGNVGIGTSSPTQKLEVNGVVKATGGILFPDGNIQTSAYMGGGGETSQWATSGSNIYYSSGTVSVGQHMAGSNDIKMDHITGTITHTWNGGSDNRYVLSSNGQNDFGFPVGWDAGALKLRGSRNGYVIMTAGGGYVDGGEGKLLFFLNQTSTPQVAFRASGNVGIGTAFPSQKLDVAGAIAVSGTSVIDANRNIVNAAGGAFAGNMNVGGSVIIGNRATTSYKLDIVGNVRANEVVVNTDGSDFVFDDGYKLMDLARLADYIKENKHLPDIATAEDMQKSGLGVGAMQTKLLQKIEELTLYVIDQEKRMQEQNKRIEKLEKENAELLSQH